MDPSIQFEQKTEKYIIYKYWSKWTLWLQELRKQRHLALRVFQFQNQLEEKLIKNVFQKWKIDRNEEKQIQNYQTQLPIFQQKIVNQSNLRLQDNQSQLQNNDIQDDQDDEMYQMGLAIRYEQRKTCSKVIRGLIKYGIQSKKLQKNLAKVYGKYLLKKYFDIINQFKIHSKQKKIKKAQTSLGNSYKKQQNSDLNLNAKSQIDYTHTNPSFKQSLFKPNIQLQEQSSFVVGYRTVSNNFARVGVLGQSRRSQFSSVSASQTSEFETKRRYKPITELPSMPNFSVIPQINQSQRDKNQRNEQNSPIKEYNQSRINCQANQQSQTNSISESKTDRIQQKVQESLNNKIMQLVLKQKLLTLSLISGQQFSQGMEYQNYREKTKATFKKIKQITSV